MNKLSTWHDLVANRDTEGLDRLLADDVVFHSPVLHKPQTGKALTTLYLTGALQVLGNETFRYVREVVQGDEVVLEFETDVDGIHINGVDLIRWNEAGRIVDFKVMVRPLKAINLLHEKMAALLAGLEPDRLAPERAR